jgi:predicted nucleic acid-binding protein
MYLIGASHPHKAESQVILERLIAGGERLVTDAEVLQEILHFTGIRRSASGKPSGRRSK